jgi:diaminohydroxyphosphoribosylaminopyrimidine deaminase/5-amino-6-(5-phosphoribosylamino)uracil reductase
VNGNNPVRIFIDKDLEVPLNFNIYSAEAKTLVFNALKEEVQASVHFIKIDFKANVLDQICSKLYALKIQSVLLEGGTFLLNEFINKALWDEAYVFVNPELNFEKGIKAPVFEQKTISRRIGKDELYHQIRL